MASFLEKLDKFIFSYFYNQFTNKLREETLDCDSVLDIGCGYMPSIKKVTGRMKRSVGMDAFMPSVEKARAEGTHTDFIVGDVTEELKKLPSKSFDAVMALDLIEHLEKEKGLWLLSEMERIACKKVIVFTPNGFVPQQPYADNPWQEHKSGWLWSEMRKYGFKLLGFGGYKTLRGERFSLKYKPRIFWKVVSFASQLWVHGSPEYAYGILCIKELK